MQLATTLRPRRGRWRAAPTLPIVGATAGEIDALCGVCWAEMAFSVPPWCAVCGLLFPHSDGRGGGLWAHPSSQAGTGARSVQCHRNNRRLLTRLEQGDQTNLARAFGRWIQRAGRDVLAGADLLMPVPPHCTRPSLAAGRFNQSAGSCRRSAVRRPAGGCRLAGVPPAHAIAGDDGPPARDNARGAFAAPRSQRRGHLVRKRR